jgi:hypothetical protein
VFRQRERSMTIGDRFVTGTRRNPDRRGIRGFRRPDWGEPSEFTTTVPGVL